jgi:hypothetical protein
MNHDPGWLAVRPRRCAGLAPRWAWSWCLTRCGSPILQVGVPASELAYDLAVSTTEGRPPAAAAAGFDLDGDGVRVAADDGAAPWLLVAVAVAVAAGASAVALLAGRRRWAQRAGDAAPA